MSRGNWAMSLRALDVNSENQSRLVKPLASSGLQQSLKPRQALAPATNTLRQVSIRQAGSKKADGDVKADAKLKPVVSKGRIVINDENAVVQVKNDKAQGFKKPVVRVNKVTSVVPRPSLVPEQQASVVAKEEPVSFSHFLLPSDVEDIDAGDENNALLATEYVNDIYAYLRSLERKQTVSANFLSIQKEMTPKMRSVLVDWLINVHHQFKMLPESLYMGIGVMDRFFQVEVVSKDKIQLVGVTAFFIASKYEEIYPPDLTDFVSICDSLYSKRDILKMEMTILRVLKFEIGRPLPLHFLRRNSKAAHADPKIHTLAKYLMELTLLEHTCSHWSPSLLAATALYVTLKVLADKPSVSVWTPTLAFFSNYTEQQLLPHAAELCKLISKADKSRYVNIRKKYSSAKHFAISLIPELDGEYVRSMAAISAS